MKVRAIATVALASVLWLSPPMRAQQAGAARGSSGGGRSGTAPARPAGERAGPAQGTTRAGDGPSGGGAAPKGPFTSTLEFAPARPNPSRLQRPFLGEGLALPLFDPLWWSQLQPETDGAADPNNPPAPSSGTTGTSFTTVGPSLIQPSAATFRPPPLTIVSASGTLRVNVRPSSAQLYVDGFYVGTVEEFAGPGLALPPGWHRLEFRATGYATPAVNVTIDADRTTTYESELQALQR